MYPNMRNSRIISIDIETKDSDLIKMGPGVYRSIPHDYNNEHGYILGVSMVDECNNKGYWNLGHYDCTKELRDKNLSYLKEILGNSAIKIGQNLLYDLDWLENWAMIKVNGPLIDVGIAEGLLDENQRKYNLDFMGKKYFGENEGKMKDELQDFCDINNFKGDVRKWLWKMPHYLVEKYAIQDVDLPMKIWKIQESKLEEEELIDLMKLECALIRTLLLMRKTGVKIDTKKRDENSMILIDKVEEIYFNLTKQIGQSFNFRSSQQLAKVFEQFEVPYAVTEKGNPSITRDVLLRLEKGQTVGFDGELIKDEERIELGKNLVELRRADKILKSFVNGSLVKYITKGDLIHCSFYNMLTDQFGTRSGRFSSANPNLQQIPSRGVDDYYGHLARVPFIPFDNCWWVKFDYSQIEYRFMAHFARGPGSDKVRQEYNDNPNIDYHQYIQDLTGLKRRFAKNLNFGVAYGMGANHMAEFFQWTLEYCYDMLNTYHSNAPFVKSTIRKVESIAKRRGYIKTFLKRRSRLIDPNKAYTMFCRLMQGSAADLMKKAMYEIYDAGIFDVLSPHLTVHDEIDVSVPKTKEGIEACLETRNIMETCVQLKVPIVTDMEIGDNWSELKEVENTEELYKRLEK